MWVSMIVTATHIGTYKTHSPYDTRNAKPFYAKPLSIRTALHWSDGVISSFKHGLSGFKVSNRVGRVYIVSFY